MFTLLVMRHAKSSWKSDATTDHARPLNKRGRRAAPLMASMLLLRDLTPAAVLSSDAQRTRETWARMAPKLPPVATVRFEPSLYFGDLEHVLDLVIAQPCTASPLLVLGHNPDWERLVHWLTGEQVLMKTANIAVLRGQESQWSSALEARGRFELCEILRPR